MPEGLFVAQENEAGETVYVEVNEVEGYVLPDDLVEGSPKFQKINELRQKTVVESKKYKKRAQAAEAALEQDSSDDAEGAPPTPDTPPVLDKDALFTEFRERIAQEDAQASALLEEKDTKLRALIATHKLGDEALTVLRTSSEPDVLAKFLGTSQFNFEDGQGGATAVDTPEALAEVFGRIESGLGITKK